MIDLFLIHTIEKFVLEPSIEKIVVGVHGDWVSHAEDLVDKYLPLHKDRIIITKGGADRNSSIERLLKLSMLIVQSQKMISWSHMTQFVLLSHFE